MRDDDEARRRRAEEIRRQIAGMQSGEEDISDEAEDPGMKPSESPKEYIERRQREIQKHLKEKA